MATVITSECINCGACEPECPNTAIYQGGVEWEFNGEMHPAISEDIFYIVPEKCTECVGFFDHEACAAVCPVDCCVPDPERPETEEVLLARARELHPDTEFSADFPSRFKTDGGGAAAPAAEAAAAPEAAPAPTAVAASPAVAAPQTLGRVEKPLSPPKIAATRPVRPVKEKVFADELPGTFEDAFARLTAQRRSSPSLLKLMAVLLQPILGALPFSQKKVIEDAVGDGRLFTAAGATGVNVLHNLILYPIVAAVAGALWLGRDVFSSQLTSLITLGVALASLEAILRMREAVLFVKPKENVVYRSAWYGPPLAAVFVPIVRLLRRSSEQVGTVAVEGFHGGTFGDKLERERRYGEVYSLDEQANGYFLRLEFPRTVPHSAQKEELGVADEMPDYDYDLSLHGRSFVAKGSVVDPLVRKLAAVSPAFPPDFTTNVELPGAVHGFKHRVRDKTLEVVLLK
jgi:ferredoxin